MLRKCRTPEINTVLDVNGNWKLKKKNHRTNKEPCAHGKPALRWETCGRRLPHACPDSLGGCVTTCFRDCVAPCWLSLGGKGQRHVSIDWLMGSIIANGLLEPEVLPSGTHLSPFSYNPFSTLEWTRGGQLLPTAWEPEQFTHLKGNELTGTRNKTPEKHSY